MKQKLLDALKLKFPGVSETTLNIIATNKAGSVTDENLTSTVEAITLDLIIQSATDSKIADANKKAVQNYESTHGLKDGKPVKDPEKKDPPAPSDDMPAWAKALKEQNDALLLKVSGFESKTKQQQNLEKLHAKLTEKKIPLTFAKRVVLNDESEIDTMLAEIENDYTELNQQKVNDSATIVPGVTTIPGDRKSVEAAVDTWYKTKVKTKKT
jgi:hypothetical protein